MSKQKFVEVLFSGFAILLSGCATTDIGSKLKEYAFSELKPPSNLTPPGTLITVKDTDPFIVGIICPQANAFGPGVKDRVLSSDSSASTTAKDLTGNFKLDAQYLSRIKANINARASSQSPCPLLM